MRRMFLCAQDPVSCETHAIGAVAAIGGGALFLLRGLIQQSGAPALGAAMCFCLSMVALYTASAVYHYYPGNVNSGGIKRRLRKLDHSMIYVLIAGSYTPFSLMMPQPKGVRFCAAIWAVALVGVLVKMFWINAPRILSTLFYLVMGWAVVFAWGDFTAALGQPCLTLVAAGGACYSVGAVFYALKRPNINDQWTFHEIFHVCILAGSLFHYLAVYFYVL